MSKHIIYDTHNAWILINLCSEIKGKILTISMSREITSGNRWLQALTDEVSEPCADLINYSRLTKEGRALLLNAAIKMGVKVPKCLVFSQTSSIFDHPDCTPEIRSFIEARELEAMIAK